MHAQPDMAVSFVGLIALAGLAAVVFLAVLGLIALLTNPRTRDIAKILLGGFAAVALLAVLMVGMWVGVARREVAHREATVARLKELGEQMHKDQLREAIILPDASDKMLPPPEPKVSESLSAEASQQEGKSKLESATEPVEMAAEPAGVAEGAATSEPAKLPPDPRTRPSSEDSATEEVKPDEAHDEAAEKAAAKPEEVADEAEKVSDKTENVAAKSEEVAEPTEEATATPEEPKESPVVELSVAPLADVNRPEWVDRKPYKEGSVYCWPVATDPRPDVFEAEGEALPAALDRAVADYITTKLRLGSKAAQRIHLDDEYLRDKLVGEDVWIEPLNLSVGEFVRVHALVKFDFDAKSRIENQWERQRLEARLWSAGGFVALALVFLSVVYCYLKIGQVTGGSRRVLLRFAAILVILGLMLVAARVISASIV